MFALTAFSAQINAQIKVGTNPTTITADTNLEVESANGSKVQVSKDLGKITIKDGSQTVNKVLTSDANGVATWKDTQQPVEAAFSQNLVATSPFRIVAGTSISKCNDR